MLPAEVKTQVQTAHATTIAASLMLSISAVAMFFSWGMMAVLTLGNSPVSPTQVTCNTLPIPMLGSFLPVKNFSQTIIKSANKVRSFKKSPTAANFLLSASDAKQYAYYFGNIARQNPKQALDYAVTRADWKLNEQNCLPEPAQTEGKLLITHVDDFNNYRSETRYTLFEKNGASKILYFSKPGEYIESGTEITLHGLNFNNRQEMVVDNYTVTKKVGNPPVSGPQTIMNLLVHQKGSTGAQLTKEELSQQVFGGINNFYNKNSYGSVSLKGRSDIGGVSDFLPTNGSFEVEMGYACSANMLKACDPNVQQICGIDEGQCQLNCSADIVLEQIIQKYDKQISFVDNSRVLIFFDKASKCFSNAVIGKKDFLSDDSADYLHMSASVIGNNGLKTIAHELGHGFGNPHASFLSCQSEQVTFEDCEAINYGDMTDVMGWGSLTHSNAPLKENLGWLSESDMAGHRIQSITASGNYPLEPLSRQNNGIQALKILRGPNLPALYIERREKIDLDSAFIQPEIFNGIVLHYWYGMRDSYAFDPKAPFEGPYPPGESTSLVLPFGSSYTDPILGTKIISGEDVDIHLGRTDFDPPTVSVGQVISEDCTTAFNFDAQDISGISRIELFKRRSRTGDDSNDILFATLAPPENSYIFKPTEYPRFTLIVYRAFDAASIVGTLPDNVSEKQQETLLYAGEQCDPPISPLSVSIEIPETGKIINEGLQVNSMPTIDLDKVHNPVHLLISLKNEDGIDSAEVFLDVGGEPFIKNCSLSCLTYGGCGNEEQERPECLATCPLGCDNCNSLSSRCLLKGVDFYDDNGKKPDSVVIDLNKNLDEGIKNLRLEVSRNSNNRSYVNVAMLRVNVMPPAQYIRGDVDQDGKLTITDPITILNYLFKDSAPLTCLDAADINDDGIVNITDAIILLNYLYAGAPATLPEPFNACGADPTPEDILGCASFLACPH